MAHRDHVDADNCPACRRVGPTMERSAKRLYYRMREPMAAPPLCSHTRRKTVIQGDSDGRDGIVLEGISYEVCLDCPNYVRYL